MPLYGDGRSGTLSATVTTYGGYKTPASPTVYAPPDPSKILSQPAAVPYLQQKSQTTFALTNVITFASTAGNTLTLALEHQSTGTTTVTDTAGNVWQMVSTTETAGASGQYKADIWYVTNAAAVTSVTITNTVSSTLAANLVEWPGGPYTVRGFQAVYTGLTNNTPAPATVSAIVGDIVVGLIAFFASGDTATTDPPYRLLSPTGTATTRLATAYNIATTAGTEGPGWTVTGGSNTNAQVAVSFTPTVASTPITLTDTGTGTEALVVSGSVALAEVGAGSDALAVAVPVSLADTSTATDAFTTTVAVTLPDTGAVSDAVTVKASATLSDTGSGSDALTVGASTVLADSATAVDAVTVKGSVPVADVGTGADALLLSAPNNPALAETGSGSDVLTVRAATPLADTASAVDGFAVAVSVLVADSGALTEALGVLARISLADLGAAVDALAGATPPAPPSHVYGTALVTPQQYGTATLEAVW